MDRRQALRSVLFMPASNARALAKIGTLEADAFILDLEDAVTHSSKAAARENVARYFADETNPAQNVWVRINSPETPHFRDDMLLVSRINPAAIVVPKISSESCLRTVWNEFGKAGPGRTDIWAMIENISGVINVREIAGVQARLDIPLAGLIVGANDLIKDARMRPRPDRQNMIPILVQCILAAKAYDLAVLDSVYNAFRDVTGFAAECEQAVDLGFDGKTLIHPAQIGVCNAAFAPSAQAVAFAEEVISAFARPENANVGALQIRGQMVERLHLDAALRTLALAQVSR